MGLPKIKNRNWTTYTNWFIRFIFRSSFFAVHNW